MRFASKQTKCIQHVTGTVRIKEFKNKRLYKNKEVIDDRIKRMQALASFQNVKNVDSVDEREEESKADKFDLLAEYRPEKIATV